MNRDYTIRRENMLAAIRKAGLFANMGRDLPPDESAEPHELEVLTGNWLPHWTPPRPEENVRTVKLTVRVMPNGVANRIQTKCPECGRWIRFSGLQQHVGTPTCRKAAKKETQV